jgi:predicted RNA-binding Zn ribbon-like protein
MVRIPFAKVEDKLVMAKARTARNDCQLPPSRAATLALVGCALAFDFANTCSGRGGLRRVEHLRCADDVVVWAHHAKILAHERVDALRRRLRRDPALGRQLLRRTLELREVVYGIGLALSARAPLRRRAVDRLGHIHARCLACAQLTPVRGVYGWTWESARWPVAAILGPIALSVVALLSQTDLSRVKQCPGRDCGWLFVDRTKNGARRWCEMEVCGNRAKQRRLRARKGR